MRQLSTIIMLASSPFLLMAQDSDFVVKGKLGHSRANMAFLYYPDPETRTDRLDSVRLIGGAYSFTGKVATAVKAVCYTTPDYNRIELYIEPGIIQVTSSDSLSAAVVQGGPVNADFNELRPMIAPVLAKGVAINKEARAAMAASPEKRDDKEFKKEWDRKMGTVTAEVKSVYREFIKQKPDNLITIEAVQFIVGNNPDLAEARTMFEGLGANVRNSPMGKAYAEKLTAINRVGIGSLAPDFSQPDPAGRIVSLKDYRGKYVLVDFWASWCGPCRAENPNLLSAYNLYKGRNFTILGVSVDKLSAKEAWLKAIAKDGLTWTQVSELNGWNTDVCKVYNVDSVPKNFLIDPDGKIIAVNLRGEGLNKKLEQVFAPK